MSPTMNIGGCTKGFLIRVKGNARTGGSDENAAIVYSPFGWIRHDRSRVVFTSQRETIVRFGIAVVGGTTQRRRAHGVGMMCVRTR